MGSLSLLQPIFPTQESNWGLLHCRRILYQLSFLGSPGVSWRQAWSQMEVVKKNPNIWQLCQNESHSVASNSLGRHRLYSPWNSPGQNTGVGSLPFSRESSQPRIKPRSPALQVDFLPAESQGKPKNTGVDSLSLLRQIFPTQKLNGGLLHCRWILYQLSYFYPLSFFTYKMKIRGPDSIGF